MKMIATQCYYALNLRCLHIFGGMRIKDMCGGERPREKLLGRGADALSDGELLAIFIMSGTKGCSAIEAAQRLLQEAGGSLSALASMDKKRLMGIPGIAQGKAAMLMAAFELGRRFLVDDYRNEHEPVKSSVQVYKHMISRMKGLAREECWVLLLNRSCFLLDCVRISTGSMDSTVMDTKSIVRLALDRRASSLVLVHNHPSGNPVPSTADIRETESLREALGSFNLTLVDHVVVCDDCFYSFHDHEVARSPFSCAP